MDALSGAVSETVRRFADMGCFPSAAVRVFDREGTICRFELGEAAEGTVFDMASLTKVATGTQVLLAMDEGRMRLDDGILRYLPELGGDELLRARLNDVTVEKLLSHTSGLVDWYPFYSESAPFKQALRKCLERCAPVEPGVYSDLNYMLLGLALERVYGMPLSECLRVNLVEPLNLGTMTYLPDAALDIMPSSYGNPIEEDMCRERGIAFDLWRPHTPLRGQVNDGNAWYYFGGVAGSAGIFANAEAYERLGRFHLSTDSALLKSAMLPRFSEGGLCWRAGNEELYPRGCGHSGFTGTDIYLCTEKGFGVVALTNRLFYEDSPARPTLPFRTALHQAVYASMTAR